MLNRRSFLTGLICAPAVIRVAPLMVIKPKPVKILTLAEYAKRIEWSNCWEDLAKLFTQNNKIIDHLIYKDQANETPIQS